MQLTEADPKGLVRESYAIEGISPGECRSIFLDWALSLATGVSQLASSGISPGHRRNRLHPDGPSYSSVASPVAADPPGRAGAGLRVEHRDAGSHRVDVRGQRDPRGVAADLTGSQRVAGVTLAVSLLPWTEHQLVHVVHAPENSEVTHGPDSRRRCQQTLPAD